MLLTAVLLTNAAAENLSGLSAWTVTIMEALGPLGVGFLVVLDSIFPPIPSELVLPLAGFTASRGQLSLVLAIVFATIGSVVGALVLYAVGRWIRLDRIVRIAVAMPLVDIADVHQTIAWFDRHGEKAVFFGRMIPIFRSLISIPAGLRAMPMLRFIALTAVGSAIWNTVLIVAGYCLGENWSIVEASAGYFQTLVIVVIVIAALGWIVLKVRRRRRQRLVGLRSTDGMGEQGAEPEE